MDESVRLAWASYRAWAITSRKLRKATTSAGSVVLLLVVIGTVVGTFAPVVDKILIGGAQPTGILAAIFGHLPFIAAVTLGVAAYLTAQLLSNSERQAWVKARAIAEGFKSEAFKYLAGAPPYVGPGAAAALADKAADLQRSPPSVLREPVASQKVDGMPVGPLSEDRYVELRIREQIDRFYVPGIVKHQAALTQAKAITLVFGIATVMLSAAATSTSSFIAPLLGVLTTLAASFAAWFQSGRHQQIAQNYQDTVSKLELLLARHKATGGSFPDLVVNAEAIMQAEHAAWRSDWDQPVPSVLPNKTTLIAQPALSGAGESDPPSTQPEPPAPPPLPTPVS